MHQAIKSVASTHGLKLLWLLSVVTAFFYNIHAFPLFDLDEGAFSQATREMFLRGDFLTTFLNGEPRYDKPILVYWLQALSVAAFGVDEFAFRLPSAIAASLWSLLTVAFTRRISTPGNGYIAGILMAGAAGVGLIGKAATADALLNFCLAGGLLSIYLHLTESDRRFLIAAAVFVGLGFLTKGPVAIFIPAVVSLLFALWSGRLKPWLRMVSNPTAWLIFILIGLPWYVAQYLKDGSAFLESFIGTHNIGRFSTAMEGHAGHWWYYLPVVLLVTFPFSLPVLQPFLRIKSLIKTDIGRFLLSWFLFVLVFFSFSATKLPHYMLYGVTPLFILAALHLDDQPKLKAVFFPLVLVIILMVLLPKQIEYMLPGIKDPYLHAALSNPERYFNSVYQVTLVLILLLSLWLPMSRRWPRQVILLTAGIISTFIFSELLLPLAGRIQQEPVRQAGLIAAKYPNTAVMWRLDMPSFSVYSGRITPNRKPHAGELVLTKSRYLDRLPAHELLFEDNGIALALLTSEETGHVPVITQPPQSSAHLGDPSAVAGGRTDHPSGESQPASVSSD